MTLFSAVRGLWWVASEVVDAARQLVEFRPGRDGGLDAAKAEALAAYEADVECLEAQDDCGLGGSDPENPIRFICDDDTGWVVQAEPPLTNGELIAIRCLLLESSAAPGVSPVEAADNDPGVDPPIPTPGSQTSLTAEETVAGFKAWLYRNGNGDALCTCGHTFRWHLADLSGCADCTAFEPVYLRCSGFNLDRTMRQRQGEDRNGHV